MGCQEVFRRNVVSVVHFYVKKVFDKEKKGHMHTVVLALGFKSGDVSCKSVCHPSPGKCRVRVEK